jgi:hypothetical protein
MRKIFGYTFLIFVLFSLLLLGSCDSDNQQEARPEKPPREAPQEKVPDTTVAVKDPDTAPVCGDGICSDVENCAEDCSEGCEDTSDCDDADVCGDEGFCVPGVDVNEETEAIYYERLVNLEDRAEDILDLFDDIYNFLEDMEDDIDSGDYDDLEEDLDAWYEDVEGDVEDLKDDIDLLYAEVNDLTTAETEEFSDAIVAISDGITALKQEVTAEIPAFYADINEEAGIEGMDLMAKLVLFEGMDDDNEEATFSVTVINIGADDVDDEFNVYVRLTVEGDSVGSCTEEVDNLDSAEETTIECSFDIEEYYEDLEDGDEADLDFDVDVEVDSDDDIEELSELNNEITWKISLTIEDFE